MTGRAGRTGRTGSTEGPGNPSARSAPSVPTNGRLLAVDWGTKRIGLAISDPSQSVATPLGTLTRRAGRRFPMGQLKTYLQTHHPVGCVLGLPLTASGAEGAAARAARETGALIAAKTGLPVAFWDERMTTARVHATRREVGGRSGRGGTDALAATTLLQAFLDHQRS